MHEGKYVQAHARMPVCMNAYLQLNFPQLSPNNPANAIGLPRSVAQLKDDVTVLDTEYNTLSEHMAEGERSEFDAKSPD